MGSKGKVTFIYSNESGDIQTGLTSVYICPAGGTPSGPSAIQMSDSDTNGTYIVDIEDDGLISKPYDVYAEGTKEIDSFMVISKDLIDDSNAYGASITDHESEITSLQSSLSTITGDITDLEGSVDDLQADILGITTDIAVITSDIATITGDILNLEGSAAACTTHIADSTNPHSSILTQTGLVCSNIKGVSGDSSVLLQGKDGTSPIIMKIENYGSPSGYTADLSLTKGALKFNDVEFRQSSDNLYLDIKNSINSIFYIHNSEANKSCKIIIDGSIDGDVDEVVSARAEYANLNARLDSFTESTDVLSYIYLNMNELMGINDNEPISAVNYIHVQQVVIPYKIAFTQLKVNVHTVNASANHCFGIYDNSGNLKSSTGAVAISSVGIMEFPVTPKPTLAPGVYIVAWTSSSLTGRLYGYTPDAGLHERWGRITSGGGTTLPSTIILGNINSGKRFMPIISLDAWG